jgi:hypothetical protein
MATHADTKEPQGVSRERQTRCFVRAFVATNYLLGKRGAALGEGLDLGGLDPGAGAARQALLEVVEQFSNGVQANRAHVLAAEVGRLMRALAAQKLK